MNEILNVHTRMIEKVVDSVLEIDFTGLNVPIIVLYDHPVDHPTEYIARVFDGDKPTNVIMRASCPWLLRFDIDKYTSMKYFERGREDDPHIIGVYI